MRSANIACHAFIRASAAAGLIAAWTLAACMPCAAAEATSPQGETPSPVATAGQHPYDPECLTVTQSSAATYMIDNTACASESVLATITLPGDDVLARCFTKKIRSQLSIASEQAVPVITYQCIEGAPGCAMETLRGMFPECHAG